MDKSPPALAELLETETDTAYSPANPDPEMVAAESTGRVVAFLKDDAASEEIY